MAKYTVQSGDTLTAISLRFGLCQKGPGNTIKDWQPCLNVSNEIALKSGLKDMNQIKPGMVLELPDPERAAVVASGPAVPWSMKSAPPVAVAPGQGKSNVGALAIAAGVIGAGIILGPKLLDHSVSGLSGLLGFRRSRRSRRSR